MISPPSPLQLGVYTDGPAGSTGTWTPLPGVSHLQPLDFSVGGKDMHFYASKSFFDPVGVGRRIYYGWAVVPPASVQTLARVTNYHAGLQRLTFAPLPELASLRAVPPLFVSDSVIAVSPGTILWLGDGWRAGAGNQSEVTLSFVLPPSGRSTFGLAVLVGAPSGGGVNVSTPITLTFDAASFTANVTVGGAPARNLTYYMPGVDLPGGDYNVTDVTYTDPHVCQAACTADGERCQAYTYVTRPPLVGSCCLKGSVPAADANPTCTSGSKHGGGSAGVGGALAAIPLLRGDIAIDVRVFVDSTFIEVFVMEGRVAFTYGINSGAEAGAAGVTLFADATNPAPVAAANVSVWHLNSIWTTPDTVLQQAAAAASVRRAREEQQQHAAAAAAGEVP